MIKEKSCGNCGTGNVKYGYVHCKFLPCDEDSAIAACEGSSFAKKMAAVCKMYTERQPEQTPEKEWARVICRHERHDICALTKEKCHTPDPQLCRNCEKIAAPAYQIGGQERDKHGQMKMLEKVREDMPGEW